MTIGDDRLLALSLPRTLREVDVGWEELFSDLSYLDLAV